MNSQRQTLAERRSPSAQSVTKRRRPVDFLYALAGIRRPAAFPLPPRKPAVYCSPDLPASYSAKFSYAAKYAAKSVQP